MREIKISNAFKKSYKRMEKRGKDTDKLKEVVNLLAEDAVLPESYRDHALAGSFSSFRDCHIEPDWVLIYKKEDDVLFLEVTLICSSNIIGFQIFPQLSHYFGFCFLHNAHIATI